MNDLSPPDASAAPTSTVSPPPAEPPDSAPAEPSAQADAPQEPLLVSGADPLPEPTSEAATPVTPPALAFSASLERLPEQGVASTPQPASAALPTAEAFALPLVSEDDPCGPDLDLEGDTEFMNFIAATEGLLPASYYAFNRATIDFSAALQAAEKLLKRTLDLRLIVLMAKLSILNRDVASFAQRLRNVAWLVKEHWDAANPRADGDDYSGRIAQLATLEDNAVVLLPLQHAPLIETNREGALSYRDQLLASGAAQPRSVTLYDLRGQKQTTEPEKFMPAKNDRAAFARGRNRKTRRPPRDAARRVDGAPDDQGGDDRACRLREGDRVAEARQARGRDGGVRARRPHHARSHPCAAARGGGGRDDAGAASAAAAAAAPLAFTSSPTSMPPRSAPRSATSPRPSHRAPWC